MKTTEKQRRHQAGFTLVELLVTVAIIVALAAAIIPNVSKFTGKGTQGSQAAELQAVQAAMDAMMAENGTATVTATATGAPVSDWSSVPTEAGAGGLADYLRSNPTTYTYCWDGEGKVTQTTANCP